MPPGEKLLLEQNCAPGDGWRMKHRAMEETEACIFPRQRSASAEGGLLAGWRWGGGGGGFAPPSPKAGEQQGTGNGVGEVVMPGQGVGYEGGWGPEGWLGALAVAA